MYGEFMLIKKVFYYLQTESQRHDNQLPPLLYPAGLSTQTLYIHDRCSRGSCDHCRDWRHGSSHLGRLCRRCRHRKWCLSLPSFCGFWESFVMDSSVWNNDKGLLNSFISAYWLLIWARHSMIHAYVVYSMNRNVNS